MSAPLKKVNCTLCKRKVLSALNVTQDNQLEHNIDRLRYAAMDLLTKLSRQFKHRRNGVIFLVNNFTHIVQVRHCPVCPESDSTIACHARMYEMLSEAVGRCTARQSVQLTSSS